MKNTISRSSGFILPLMMILLLILSLLMLTLYQAESSHLALFHAVEQNEESEKSLANWEQTALKQASESTLMIPNPSDQPVDGQIYLRAIDSTGRHIWQEKSGNFMLLIECDQTAPCHILRLRRLI